MQLVVVIVDAVVGKNIIHEISSENSKKYSTLNLFLTIETLCWCWCCCLSLEFRSQDNYYVCGLSREDIKRVSVYKFILLRIPYNISSRKFLVLGWDSAVFKFKETQHYTTYNVFILFTRREKDKSEEELQQK